jgi:peptidoglycan L-alanyl-D-glutamate endopeptidase CwlK
MDVLDALLIGGLIYLVSKSYGAAGAAGAASGLVPESVAAKNESELSKVNPALAEKARFVINEMARRGYVLIVAEGLRTNALQAKYYAQGRTTAGAIITYKKAGESEHNQGKAIDFDFIVDGRQSNSLSNNWALLGQLAKSAGLTWGGDYKKLKDYRHVEI